jgi:hypothetical protein
MFSPSVAEIAPNIESYEEFFNVNTHMEKFNKLCFIESQCIAGEVLRTIENDLPFSEMSIPETGKTRVAVGLGLIIGVCLAMGILPLSDSVPQNIL